MEQCFKLRLHKNLHTLSPERAQPTAKKGLRPLGRPLTTGVYCAGATALEGYAMNGSPLTRLFLPALIFSSSLAAAASVSVRGALLWSDGAANDTHAYTFAVAATSTVTIQSYGYGGSSGAPGGMNLAGAVIPAGGFDPYFSLFTGTGPLATFVASNDDGACPPATPDGGLCGDSTLSLSLSAGTYTLVVAAFDNMSLAENLGSGTLSDGFSGLGNYDPLRTSNYAIDINGNGLDTLFRDGFE